MKKTLAMVLSLVMMLVLAAGCGNSSSPGSDSSSGDGGAGTEPAEAKGTVEFMYWGGEQKEAMEEIANGFMAEHSNIKVNLTQVPNDQYWTKLLTSIASGAPCADVCWINPTYAVSMMNANQLVNVQDLYDSKEIDSANFVQAALNSYTGDDGNLYGVPKDFQTVCLIYNKQLFDDAGLSYPGNDYTWEQMLSDAQKLTKTENGTTTQWGYVHNASVMSSWFVYCYANGGVLFDKEANGGKYIDTEANRQAFQNAADLIFKYGVAPDGSVTAETTPDELFMNGKVAMITYVPSQIANYVSMLGEDAIGIAAFPAMTQQATISNNLGYGIPAGTQNLEAAKLFLAYLASREGQTPQAEIMIPAYQGIVSKMEEDYAGMNFSVYIEAGKYAVGTPVEKVSGNAARKAVEAEVQNIIFGEKDVAAALQDAEASIIKGIENAK